MKSFLKTYDELISRTGPTGPLKHNSDHGPTILMNHQSSYDHCDYIFDTLPISECQSHHCDRFGHLQSSRPASEKLTFFKETQKKTKTSRKKKQKGENSC